MEHGKKKDLIDGLKEALNVETPEQKTSDRKFDPSTGTIYCGTDRHPYDITAIEASRDFMVERAKEQSGYKKVYDIAASIINIYLNQIKVQK